MELDELKDCSYKASKMTVEEYTLELSNHEVQDILENMNMIDDNGNCPYTAEEIFKGDNSISGYTSKGYWETDISEE